MPTTHDSTCRWKLVETGPASNDTFLLISSRPIGGVDALSLQPNTWASLGPSFCSDANNTGVVSHMSFPKYCKCTLQEAKRSLKLGRNWGSMGVFKLRLAKCGLS